MRGGDARTEALFSYVSCEARVPMNHPLGAIRNLVNEALAALSPENSMPSPDGPSDKAVELRNKARADQGRGGHRLPAMVAQKAHRPVGALQPWHVDVQVHAVDPLDRQSDMIGEQLGHSL